MKNVGRNDPCPCGSGKKYKKCHGASNVIEINPNRYNHELDNLHQGLIDFSLEYFETEIGAFLQEHPQPRLIDNQILVDSFFSGITIWFILNQPVQNGQTIFDIYNEEQQKKVKYESVRNAFSNWKEAVFSIFKVIEVTDEKYTLQDIRSNETYYLRTHEERILEDNGVLTGVLLPFVKYHEFLLTEIHLLKENHLNYEKFSNLTDLEFKKRYPEILADLLVGQVEEDEWEHRTHEAVAEMFSEHLRLKTSDENYIRTGIELWKDFISYAEPIIRKPEAYAAGLDYVIQQALFEGHVQSQKELANEYGVTATTVSKNAHKIYDVVEHMMADDSPEDLPELSQFDMEKSMRDIERHLSEKEFESEAELHAYLDELLNSEEQLIPELTSPRDIAQEKLYEAFESTGAEREKLIDDALRIYSNSPDAYLLKASNAKSQYEEYQLLHQAVIAGEKDLGKAFIKENKGHFWMLTETRPYMRAKSGFAIHLYNYGEEDSAIKHFKELLELNPNDNMGNRYHLLTIYLEIGDIKSAGRLLKQYDGDASANFMFNRVLIAYLQEGLTAKTKKFLKQAIDKHPLVKDLLGNNYLKKNTRASEGFGSESEAVAYVDRHLDLWNEHELLLDELAKSN
ncbi:SEC-C metal-binding domain-containing protein [Oceanobacillus sp. CAU 1775]